MKDTQWLGTRWHRACGSSTCVEAAFIKACGGEAACVQVRYQVACSAQNGCVAVGADQGEVLIRDSKNPEGPVLRFTPDEWTSFSNGIKAGDFDGLLAAR